MAFENDDISWFSGLDDNVKCHLYKFNHRYYIFEDISLPKTDTPIKYIWCIEIDRYGNKWLGTDQGLLVYREGGVILAVDDKLAEELPAMVVSPNPASNFITITLNKGLQPLVQSKNNIRIYNTIGEIVYSVGVKIPESQRIDVSGLSPGLYFVRYGTEISKFIKE